MTTLFKQQGGQYLKANHRVRYYNLLTAGQLNHYLSDINQQVEKMFEELVKSLAEKENVTENLKADEPMKWVEQLNNIRNRATEIVNSRQSKLMHAQVNIQPEINSNL